MNVLSIIFGAILALFGGGCALIILTSPSASNNLSQGLKDNAYILAMLMLPLVAGLLMIRAGLRQDREKRALKEQPKGGE